MEFLKPLPNKIIIEFDENGQSKMSIDPPNKFGLEIISNILDLHQKICEREIAVFQILKRLERVQMAQLKLNHLPSLDDIKKSKQ